MCDTRARVCSGGIPIIWPQFGKGGNTLGGIEGQAPMQQHGFARNMEWNIVETARARYACAMRMCGGCYTGR